MENKEKAFSIFGLIIFAIFVLCAIYCFISNPPVIIVRIMVLIIVFIALIMYILYQVIGPNEEKKSESTILLNEDRITKKYNVFGNIIHKLDEIITYNKDTNFFWIPDWSFEMDYNLEEELLKLGLQIEYLDDEKIEMLLSDSKDIDVKITIDWNRINLHNLKEFLFPLEKWDLCGPWIHKQQAVNIWTYACMTVSGTIDIDYRGCHPSCVLSNFYPSKFELDSTKMNSMEGFLQSLKTSDKTWQKEICQLEQKEAKEAGGKLDFEGKCLYWQGRMIDRFSDEYQLLLRRAFNAKKEQDAEFRDALLSTKGKILIHSIGKQNKEETILTEQEFIDILYELRENLE